MTQLKSNLSKKPTTNKLKIKNKRVNKLELTVRLHENPIKTKIKALVAGGVENEPIKNEDGSLDIKTAKIILENTAEV